VKVLPWVPLSVILKRSTSVPGRFGMLTFGGACAAAVEARVTVTVATVRATFVVNRT
jgi:hypothetical protein